MSDPRNERHERLGRLFLEASKLPADEQRAYVEEQCGDDAPLRDELLKMLEHDAATRDSPGVVEGGGAAALAKGLAGADAPEMAGEFKPGDRIDAYEIIERLGEGGFAVVYLAQQAEPVKRTVALKVLKAGMDSKQILARFSAERQALAMMDHEHVATIHDAGTLESGRPYFVMEHVDGRSITTFCAERRLALPERLDLIMQACGAVQHAHQKGIIHRDIKPSNVLVMDTDAGPFVKVIDFGVAKVIGEPLTAETIFTEQGQLVGTPEYMSPEQADFNATDIDTRTDVYSLGILLYELLAGVPPFDLKQVAFYEMQRTIREVDPPKPSTRISTIGPEGISDTASGITSDTKLLARLLRGDLDWIVMKALEKDRDRRYETANGLAADLRRYLADEPVAAGPPSAVYRFRKFARRNRAVVIGTLAVALVLVLGAAGTTAGLIWALNEKARADDNADVARDETARAELELRRATEVKQFIADMISSVNPEVAQGLDTTLMEQILADAIERLEGDEITDELIEAELRATIGGTYYGLGEYEVAEPFMRRALEIRRRELGDDHADTLASKHDLAELLYQRGEYEESEIMFDEVVAARRRVLGDDHEDTIQSLDAFAVLLRDIGRFDEAATLFDEAIERSSRTLGKDAVATLDITNDLARLREQQGQWDEAERLYRETLAGFRRTLGDDHPVTIKAIHNLAWHLQDRRRPEDARVLESEALERGRRVLGDDHPVTLAIVLNVAAIEMALGNLPEAERMYRDAVTRYRRVLGEAHPITLVAIGELSKSLQRQNKVEEALELLGGTLEARRRNPGIDHPDTQTAIANYGNYLKRLGRPEETEPYYREALEGRERTFGQMHPQTISLANEVARLMVMLEKWDDALAILEPRRESIRSALGDESGFIRGYFWVLHQAYMGLGRPDDAEDSLRESLEASTAGFGAEHLRTRQAVGNLGYLLNKHGKFEECLALTTPAVTLADDIVDETDYSFAQVYQRHAGALAGLNRYEEAEPFYLKTLAVCKTALGVDDRRTRQVTELIVDMYEALGRLEKAAEFRESLDAPDPVDPTKE